MRQKVALASSASPPNPMKDASEDRGTNILPKAQSEHRERNCDSAECNEVVDLATIHFFSVFSLPQQKTQAT